MDKFLITIMVLGLASYGAKTVVEDNVEGLKGNVSVESIKKAKQAMSSVSAPIQTKDGTYDPNEVDIGTMYSLAQEEARHMMETGDIEGFQKQLEANDGLLSIFGGMSEQ